MQIFDIVSSVVLSLTAIVVTIVFFIMQKKSAMNALQASLIQQFFSVEYFKDVRSIMWEIEVKWFNLPDSEREKYRDEVILGWAGYKDFSPEVMLKHEVPAERIRDDHHLTFIKREGITEHQALSVYLAFWILLYNYYESKELDEKHIVFWKCYYEYEQRFIEDFRDKVIKRISDNETKPEWIMATKELERIFRKA